MEVMALATSVPASGIRRAMYALSEENRFLEVTTPTATKESVLQGLLVRAP